MNEERLKEIEAEIKGGFEDFEYNSPYWKATIQECVKEIRERKKEVEELDRDLDDLNM